MTPRQLLLVEDDANKLEQVVRVLEVLDGCRLTVARSYQGGLRAMLGEKFSLAIVDMTLPTFEITDEEDGGRPQAYAGRELLRQLTRRNIQTPVLVVTQFDKFGEGSEARTLSQLDAEMRQDHPRVYSGYVHYDAVVAGWQEALLKRVREILS